MKHRPFKAIDIPPNHHRRASEVCRESRNFPDARRNADRRSEARISLLAAVVKSLNATIDWGIGLASWEAWSAILLLRSDDRSIMRTVTTHEKTMLHFSHEANWGRKRQQWLCNVSITYEMSSMVRLDRTFVHGSPSNEKI